jgi:hypothetical protein
MSENNGSPPQFGIRKNLKLVGRTDIASGGGRRGERLRPSPAGRSAGIGGTSSRGVGFWGHNTNFWLRARADRWTTSTYITTTRSFSFPLAARSISLSIFF